MDFWWLGLLTYSACHALHVLIWRFHPTLRKLPLLVAILFIVPCALFSRYGSAALIHFCLALNYLAIYPAFQASSPTLHLLEQLTRQAEVSLGSVRALFLRERILENRLAELRVAGLVHHMKEGEKIAPVGRVIARAFRFYRASLGLPQGDGG